MSSGDNIVVESGDIEGAMWQFHNIMLRENKEYGPHCSFSFKRASLEGRLGFMGGLLAAIGIVYGPDAMGKIEKEGLKRFRAYEEMMENQFHERY